jgi:uncharacterized caspase-like protein
LLLFLSFSLFCHAEVRVVTDDPADMFIFYSTSIGQLAQDGEGRNSPFADAFLNNSQKNEPLALVAIDIVSDTYKKTMQKQRPRYESQIINNKMYSLAGRSSSKKYALLIGNNNYQNLPNLENPVNDVQDIAVILRLLGYEVELKTNTPLAEMESAVNSFVSKLSADKESEGFFWFAGYGVQINGPNYLIPVDVNINNDNQTQNSSFSLSKLFENLQKAGNKINVVFLDAAAHDWYGGR